MLVTQQQHPPHRSVHAELPHTAPTSQVFGVKVNSLTHPAQSIQREAPALYPVRGFLLQVPLGRRPFLHRLR